MVVGTDFRDCARHAETCVRDFVLRVYTPRVFAKLLCFKIYLLVTQPCTAVE